MHGSFGQPFQGKTGIGCDVSTPMGTVTFVDGGTLFTPKPREQGQEPRYSAALLLAKNNPTVQAWKAQLDQMIAGIAASAGVRGDVQHVIQDGDTATNQKHERLADKYPEVAGHWLIQASTTNPPRVVDENVQPIEQQGPRVYSGMLGIMAITVKSFTKGGGGVTAYLQGLQRVGDGPPLGNGGSSFDPQSVFTPVNPAQIPAAPQATYTPPPAYAAPAPQQYAPPPQQYAPPPQQYAPPPQAPAPQQYAPPAPQQVGPVGYAPPAPAPQQTPFDPASMIQ